VFFGGIIIITGDNEGAFFVFKVIAMIVDFILGVYVVCVFLNDIQSTSADNIAGAYVSFFAVVGLIALNFFALLIESEAKDSISLMFKRIKLNQEIEFLESQEKLKQLKNIK
jgi:hypothetical protein